MVLKLLIDGKEVKFNKYNPKNEEVLNRIKGLSYCDVNGKKLKWISGKGGYFVYEDGTKFEGKRSEVYRMDEEGNVLAKNERTKAVLKAEMKKVSKDFVDDLIADAEYFTIDENGVFEDLKDNEAWVFALQIREGYDDNLRIAVIYRDIDGFINMKVGANLKSKVKEQYLEMMKVKDVIKKLESKKLVKKAKIEALGLI